MRIGPAVAGILALLAAVARPAAAQRGPTYCNVVEIKGEQLSNAVRVSIITDGTPEWSYDWDALMREGAFRIVQTEYGEDWQPTERFTHFPIRIMNAKSLLGTGFIPIGKYPVSHVAISTPEWAQEGVGLEIDVVNYLSSTTGEGRLSDVRYDFMTAATEDGTGIGVIWMMKDRFPAPPPPVTPKDLPAELSVASDSDGLLGIRATNAKLQDVASAISRQTGEAIAAPAGDDLRVSARLDRVTPEGAIELLARGSGLSAQRRPDGQWMITRPLSVEGGYGSSCSRTVNLQYLRAGDAVALLPNFLVEYVRVDWEANAVIVTGPLWLVERVQADLAGLDVKPPEVLLEVVAVECTSTELLMRELDLIRYLGGFAGGTHTLSGEMDLLWLAGLPRGWEAALRARDDRSAARLYSRGSLRVASGRTARISAGQRRFIIVEHIEAGLTADIVPTDVGTTLDLQPRVGSGGDVMLYLNLQVRSLRSSDPATGLPVVGVREAQETVWIRDGETIAIAGLQQEDADRRHRRVPLLGSLPVIGSLFRLPQREKTAEELAIFVTPHIVGSPLARQGDDAHG